jgi:diguanylate cyclase (GGDEF)-like protein/PAS domain S-box-containing protein
MSSYPTHLNILFIVISTAISAVVAIIALQRKKTPGAATLALLMVESIAYVVPRILMTSAETVDNAVFWFYVCFPGAAAIAPTWFYFALQYSDARKFLTSRFRIVLASVSAIFVIICLIEAPLHHSMASDFKLSINGLLSNLDWQMKPVFWVYMIYSYGLILTGTGLMVWLVIGKHRYFRAQTIWLIAGALLPLLLSLVDDFHVLPMLVGPYAFTITGLIWGLTLYRYRFMDLGSITRNSILERMTTGIVVLDIYNRILDINPAASQMLIVPEAEPVGRHFLTILPEEYALKPAEMVKDNFCREIWITDKNQKRCLELTLQLLFDTNKLMKAKLALLQDITQRKWAETRQDALLRISQLASTTHDLQEFYAAMHAIVSQLVLAPNLYIAMYDPRTEMISFPYHVDEQDPQPEPRKMVDGLTDHVIRTGQPLLISPDRRGHTKEKGVVTYGTPAVDWLGVPLKASDGQVFGVLAIQTYTDGSRYTERDKEVLTFVSTQIALVLERKEAEEALRKSEKLLRTLVENQGEGTGWIDQDENFLFANPMAETVFGAPPGTLVGRNLREFMSDEQWQIVMDQTGKRKKGEKSTYELEITRTNGENRSVLITATPQEDETGNYIGAFGVFRDNTDLKQAQESLKFMSIHDALTGVHNRNFFEIELERMEKAGITPVSILMADVDDLKVTNDRLGHAAGDDLLRRAAQMLKTSFRGEDVVARYGGDEFAVLLPNVDSIGALELVQRVRHKMELYNLQHPEKPTSFSLGMSTLENSASLVDVLKRADEQMYLEKSRKKLFISQQNR